jgi:hypothetical protein
LRLPCDCLLLLDTATNAPYPANIPAATAIVASDVYRGARDRRIAERHLRSSGAQVPASIHSNNQAAMFLRRLLPSKVTGVEARISLLGTSSLTYSNRLACFGGFTARLMLIGLRPVATPGSATALHAFDQE